MLALAESGQQANPSDSPRPPPAATQVLAVLHDGQSAREVCQLLQPTAAQAFGEIDEEADLDASGKNADTWNVAVGGRGPALQCLDQTYTNLVKLRFPLERFPSQPDRPADEQKETRRQNQAFHAEDNPEPGVRGRHGGYARRARRIRCKRIRVLNGLVT